MTESSVAMHNSARHYTPFTLRLYDFVVLWFSNLFAWRCPTGSVLLPFFQQHVGKDVHLDIGVGTGYYPAHTVSKLSKCRKVILADLNPVTLSAAKSRLKEAGYKGEPETLVHNIFQPLPQALNGTVDSVSLFYVFHCLPGTLPEKAESVAAQLAPALTSDGVVYGCTIIAKDVEHNWIGKMLMKIYHRTGVFCNYGDSAEGLREGLAVHFEDVDVRVVGRAALFVARKPHKP